MKHPLVAMSLALGLPACAGEPARPAPAPPSAAFETRSEAADIARLVPADANLVVCIRDVEAFVDEVRALVGTARPGFESMVSLEALLNQTGLGVRERDLDLTKPLVIAGTDGGAVVIVGAESPEELADVANAPSAVSGSFVAFGTSGIEPVVGSSSPLVTDLPTGQIGFRVDFDRLRDELLDARAEMQRRLLAYPSPGAEAAFAFYDVIFGRLLRGGSMDGFVDLSNGELHLAIGMDLDIELPTTDIEDALVLLAKTRARPGALSMVFADGMESFRAAFALDELTLPVSDEAARTIHAAQAELYRRMRGPTAMRFAVGSGGMRGTIIARPADVEAARAAVVQYGSKTAAALGITEFETGSTTAGGLSFETASFGIDASAWLPASGDPMQDRIARTVFDLMWGERARVAVGTTGEEVLVCAGLDDAGLDDAARATDTENSTAAIAKARRAVSKASPWMLVLWDLGPVTRMTMDVLADAVPMATPLEILDDASAELWASASTAGRVHRVDLGLDLASTIAMFR